MKFLSKLFRIALPVVYVFLTALGFVGGLVSTAEGKDNAAHGLLILSYPGARLADLFLRGPFESLLLKILVAEVINISAYFLLGFALDLLLRRPLAFAAGRAAEGDLRASAAPPRGAARRADGVSYSVDERRACASADVMSAGRQAGGVGKRRTGWLLLLALAGPPALTLWEAAIYVTRVFLLGLHDFGPQVEFCSLLVLLTGLLVIIYRLGRAAWPVVLSLAVSVVSVITVTAAVAFVMVASAAP